MRIATSQTYDRPASLMRQLTAQADSLQTQISTTKRFTTASQDVGGYVQVQSLKRESADSSAYAANAELAHTILGQADSTLDSIDTQLQRAQELASKAASDSNSASDRLAIKAELDTLRDTLLALANTKDVRGQPLFGGAGGDTAYVAGADGSVTYAGEGTPAGIPVGEGYSVEPSVTGARAFAAGSGDIFSVLATLSSALAAEGSSAAAGSTALAEIGTVQGNIALSRTSIGARAARLELEADARTEADATRETRREQVEDTDIASTTVALQKTLTALQATQASFTKLSAMSLFDYLK